ncbi:hypothetical protein [Dyadobacter sediminis]|uniref:Uncharacterized protein n=1 Tax=Dyadobacter sediminis TaxID=1493691 RepID=A0A5R9K9E1_9BACT|nr:hypothetical protein [Dyadobacter sediminis]TLU90674.1 hypothetical protein FEM55_19175 [Dyadobacter sediminis]GGC09832.1 hypothetical protein GCM10011325_40850 [Dyadobacter sediminis]
MIKRTFVLFFCLVQILAVSLFSQQSKGACMRNSELNGFFPFTVETAESPDCDIIIDNTICKKNAIVRADEFEWKESLSDLLRHRHSTYRFQTIVSHYCLNYNFARIPKIVRESVKLIVVNKGLLTLPDYYSFLHRLCPF